MAIDSIEFSRFRHGLDLKVNPEKIDLFKKIMAGPQPIDLLFNAFPDLDELAECAGFAFSQDLISSDQLSTILQFRTMKLESQAFAPIRILDDRSELTEEGSSIIAQFVSENERDQFIEQLK